ncbi:MAG TPA: acyl-CoA dehydrogenase family protein [Paracoccaceae bacterium]|nr:acyl-CoA dehydrogenase family protein [Paracoccaceae bacterium]
MATIARKPDTASLGAADILANAHALAPAIAARSAEIEALRRLPADLVQQLLTAGMFRMGRAASKGGPQMTLPQHLEVIEVIAQADPSVAWCVKIGTDSGLLAELLAPAASARLLPHADMITAGQFTAGRGTLDKVEGGYRLSGRFPFGSGITHADVVMTGGIVHDGGASLTGVNGLPEVRLAFARADELVIEDTWHTHGLRGSGSTHYRAEGVFIPEDQAMRIDEHLFANKAPLYSSGFNWVTTMAAVPLGCARKALDEAADLIAGKSAGIPPRPMGQIDGVRLAIAKAETRHGAARAFLYSSANAFWAELETGTPSTETKGRLALANVECFRMAVDVTRALFDLMGANAVFEGQVLERCTRDALTLNQHMIVSEAAQAGYGGMMLGFAHPSPLY